MNAPIERFLDTLPDEEQQDDVTFVEQCPICGEHDLVFEDGQLVDLDGKRHECKET